MPKLNFKKEYNEMHILNYLSCFINVIICYVSVLEPLMSELHERERERERDPPLKRDFSIFFFFSIKGHDFT
jgi:hypothetical protein